MTLRGGFLLLSFVLGDIPTILAAAQVIGFMPTKVDKGEGTTDANVNTSRLFDIAHSIHEKNSEYLKEHQQEPERMTLQPDSEITAHSDVPPYGLNLTRNNQNTDKSAEKQLNISYGSHKSPNNNSTEDAYPSSFQQASLNDVSRDFDDYDHRSNEDVIGYSYCNEENGEINCKYISEKRVAPAETNTGLTDSKVHQHNNYTAVSNVHNTIQNGSAGNNNKASNDTNILRNITAVLDTTENPVHDKVAETKTKEASEASTYLVPEHQASGLTDLTRPRVSYEELLESSETDSHRTFDYNAIPAPYSSYIPNEAYQMPLWNPRKARDMCFNCGPDAYCDTTRDPKVCVCNFGYRGVPPGCYQPSGDEILRSYRLLLKIHSNEKVSSTKSPAPVNSKEQYPTSVLQENKGSASTKL